MSVVSGCRESGRSVDPEYRADSVSGATVPTTEPARSDVNGPFVDSYITCARSQTCQVEPLNAREG